MNVRHPQSSTSKTTKTMTTRIIMFVSSSIKSPDKSKTMTCQTMRPSSISSYDCDCHGTQAPWARDPGQNMFGMSTCYGDWVKELRETRTTKRQSNKFPHPVSTPSPISFISLFHPIRSFRRESFLSKGTPRSKRHPGLSHRVKTWPRETAVAAPARREKGPLSDVQLKW